MNKYLIIIISVLIAIILIAVMISYHSNSRKISQNNSKDYSLKDYGLVGIGKAVTYRVSASELIDYKVMGEKSDNCKFSAWKYSEREKLAQYMKEKNLRIVEGEYVINQGTSFERAIEIFKFKEIIDD